MDRCACPVVLTMPLSAFLPLPVSSRRARLSVRQPWLVAAGVAGILHLAFAGFLYRGITIRPPLPPMQEIAVTLLPTADTAAPAPPRPQPVPSPPKMQKPAEPVKKTPPRPAPMPAKPEIMTSPARPVASAPVSSPVADSKPAPLAENRATASQPANEAPAAPAPVSAPRFDAAYLSNPAPVYPPLSRRMEEEGKVLLRVHVTPDGMASEVTIARSSGFPRLDEAALNAVRRWRFVPAKQGDKAVAAWVNVPLAFKLDL